jgi:hypothetical protein
LPLFQPWTFSHWKFLTPICVFNTFNYIFF